MASVKPRGEGRWLLVWRARTTDGDWRQSTAMFEGAKPDAEREAAARERDARRVARPDDFSRCTVRQWTEHWLTEHRRAVAPKTFEREAQLAATMTAQLGDLRLDRVTAPDIGRMLAQLMQAGRVDGEGGLAPRIVVHIRTTTSKIFGAAIKARVLDHNPVLAAKPPRVEEDDVRPLTADQVRMWVAASVNPIIRAVVPFLAATGCRRGEALALAWSDITLGNDGGTVRINKSLEQSKAGLRVKPPKSKRSRRTIVIGPETCGMLKDYRAWQRELQLKTGRRWNPMELLFPALEGIGYWPPNNASAAVRNVATRAGLRASLHSLRHTHTSMLLAAGVPLNAVSERLGHQDPALTLRVYAHLMPNADGMAAAAIEAALRG
jgi:integrase